MFMLSIGNTMRNLGYHAECRLRLSFLFNVMLYVAIFVMFFFLAAFSELTILDDFSVFFFEG